jgi:hypothetical protein
MKKIKNIYNYLRGDGFYGGESLSTFDWQEGYQSHHVAAVLVAPGGDVKLEGLLGSGGGLWGHGSLRQCGEACDELSCLDLELCTRGSEHGLVDDGIVGFGVRFGLHDLNQNTAAVAIQVLALNKVGQIIHVNAFKVFTVHARSKVTWKGRRIRTCSCHANCRISGKQTNNSITCNIFGIDWTRIHTWT